MKKVYDVLEWSLPTVPSTIYRLSGFISKQQKRSAFT